MSADVSLWAPGIVAVHRGDSALVISCPHVGTVIPDGESARYTPRALQVEDTDWHIHRLYGFAREMGATLLVPRYSRYLVDLNRSPDDAPMYPGQNNTELCPTRHFTGDPIYVAGMAPTPAEVQQRVATYWQPYHDALRAELDRVRAAHGHAVLLDAHSIKGELPWLFEGVLPNLSVGTASGASCDATLSDAVMAVFAAQADYTHVLNGRFKGGHITRHYGQPAQGVHAVQLEMAWRTYMREAPPYAWDDALAAGITPVLRAFVQALQGWRP